MAQSVLPSRYHTPTVSISDFLDNILNIDLLDLTKLSNLFQIKDPRKCRVINYELKTLRME